MRGALGCTGRLVRDEVHLEGPKDLEQRAQLLTGIAGVHLQQLSTWHVLAGLHSTTKHNTAQSNESCHGPAMAANTTAFVATLLKSAGVYKQHDCHSAGMTRHLGARTCMMRSLQISRSSVAKRALLL